MAWFFYIELTESRMYLCCVIRLSIHGTSISKYEIGTAIHGTFHVVMLKVAKYNSCKYFCFKWGSGCSGSSTQNSCCSCILHKARMVHSMPATRNSKLKLKYDKKEFLLISLTMFIKFASKRKCFIKY